MKKTKPEYANLLTEEQKEAFRKGDRYYVSPFKNQGNARSLIECHSNVREQRYATTTRQAIHEAMVDSWNSRSWN